MISPQLQYGIWGLAALRLVMPWFYPVLGWMGNMTSPFSVMNAAETIREQAVSRPDLGPLVHNLSSGQVTHYTAPATMAQRAAGIDWQMIILILWGAGGILLFIWMLWINLRFSWRIYRNRERYDGDTYGATALPVYWVEGLATPCFMSYLGDRAIYLPKGMVGMRSACGMCWSMRTAMPGAVTISGEGFAASFFAATGSTRWYGRLRSYPNVTASCPVMRMRSAAWGGGTVFLWKDLD